MLNRVHQKYLNYKRARPRGAAIRVWVFPLTFWLLTGAGFGGSRGCAGGPDAGTTDSASGSSVVVTPEETANNSGTTAGGSTTGGGSPPAFVTQGLAFHVDAEKANQSSGYESGNCSSAWWDLVNSNYSGGLLSFSGCSAGVNGWDGNGTAENPNRLTFNGGNNALSFADHAAIKITGAITVSVWLKWTTMTTFSPIVGKGRDGDGGKFFSNCDTYTYALAANNNWMSLGIGNGTSCSFVSASTADLVNGKWHHVVANWDGTTAVNGLKMYYDGVLKGQGQSTISSIIARASVLAIGKDISRGAGFSFNGSIADIAIHNRALTEAEVKQNCAAQVGRFGGASCAP